MFFNEEIFSKSGIQLKGPHGAPFNVTLCVPGGHFLKVDSRRYSLFIRLYPSQYYPQLEHGASKFGSECVGDAWMYTPVGPPRARLGSESWGAWGEYAKCRNTLALARIFSGGLAQGEHSHAILQIKQADTSTLPHFCQSQFGGEGN
jgi:hypothetical protein